MKRFLRFEFEDYYPGGGWHDFVGAFDTLEEALRVKAGSFEYVQIVDTATMTIVHEV